MSIKAKEKSLSVGCMTKFANPYVISKFTEETIWKWSKAIL